MLYTTKPLSEAELQPKTKTTLMQFPMQVAALVGAVLPGLGCYLVIAYTYVFQFDKVVEFTTTDCNVTSSLPPVSYSIGVWEPQRFIWMFIICGHIPPRLFFGIVYEHVYRSSNSVHASKGWYRFLTRGYVILMYVEAFGLVAVSIIDINNHFVLHAFFYAVWILAFGLDALFNTILHHASGFRNFTKASGRTFYAKMFMLTTGWILGLSTAFSYPHYLVTCSGWAYTMFSIAEYLLVGYNAFFHFLSFWELSHVQIQYVCNFSYFRQKVKEQQLQPHNHTTDNC